MSNSQTDAFEEQMKESADEVLAKAIPVEEVPESPMSIHIDTYYKGFHAGITIRMMDNSVIPVSNIMKSVNSLIASGFKPSWNEDTNNVHWTTPVVPVIPVAPVVAQPAPSGLGVCPKCGSPLKEAKTKAGMVFTKCSTNGWDKINKKATGCDYVKWPEKG